MTGRWLPDRTVRTYDRPLPGQLLALRHGVWRVVHVQDVPVVSDRDVEAWRAAGSPDVGTWKHRPYMLRLAHVGGAGADDLPIRDEPAGGGFGRYGNLAVPAGPRWIDWQVYPAGRWPMCSCCGEPTPCRAAIADRIVASDVARAEEHASRAPGACWSCGEVITRRQASVVYPGVNLDLPTATAPRFHTRAACAGDAERYEGRWIAADASRARILTWPVCRGSLVVHSDSVTACTGGEPDCVGHDSHDHRGSMSWCGGPGGGCARPECGRRTDVGGIRLPRRPSRLAQTRSLLTEETR